MPQDLLQEETIEVITDRLGRAKKICKPWHQEIIRWRDMYNFSHYKARAKVNETQYPDPTPTNVVDVAVGVLGSHPLEFKAVGWKPSDEEEQKTERVEKFLNGAIDITNAREEESVQYAVNLHMVRDGAAVVKGVWDPYMANRYQEILELPNPQARPEEPQTVPVRLFTELPLKTEVIDPLEIFVVPGGRQRWLYLFHETKMSVHDAEILYNFKDTRYDGRESEKMHTMGELVDYWRVAHYPDYDVIFNAVMFDKLFIPGYEPRVMEGYEDLPFSIGFFKPVDKKNPKDWGHSVIRPLEPSVKMIERNVNRRQRQIDVFSALPMIVKSLPGRSVTVDAGFGKALNMSTDEDIAFPTWPGNAPDSNLQIDYLRSRLQQSGFSDILFGMEGQGAGYAISQMTDQNRIRLLEPIRQIELLWTKWGQKVLKLTRNFAGASLLRVYGELKGENFADQFIGRSIADFKVNAKIKAEFPNQAVTNAALSTQGADVLSERTRMERYWDVDQPTDEWNQRMLEMAEQHPTMVQYGILLALQSKAAGGDQAAAMAIELMMNPQGQPGPEGDQSGPGPTGAAANQLGTAGPTGAPPPQAGGGVPPGQSTQENVEGQANAGVSPTRGVG
jgi:hypothetical protein